METRNEKVPMKSVEPISVIGSGMITALGFDLNAQMLRIENGQSGIQFHEGNWAKYEVPFGVIDAQEVDKIWSSEFNTKDFTFIEKISILAIQQAVNQAKIETTDPKCLFVFSSTKGNIDQLRNENPKRIKLWEYANYVSKFFNNPNQAVVISNACVSGVMALNWAAEMLRQGEFTTAVVIGADVLSDFIISGFKSFQSLSQRICKPFDASRDGLNLGEAAACMVLSKEQRGEIAILGGASHNDANHISGPSRTAEGMFYAVTDALELSNLKASEIQTISVHGTATPYNDEMESVGLHRLALLDKPIHGLKAFWGHCLGAVGIVESIALIESMKRKIWLPTIGFSNLGVSQNVNITTEPQYLNADYGLKIASGFSGINSALIFKREGGIV